MHSSYLYFVDGALSAAELSAARLDGHLVELGEGYIPADAIETTHLRAASLSVLLGDTLAATHLSAAWVFGAIDEAPARHAVQRAVPRRLHHRIDRRFLYRDGCIETDDLVIVGGVLVTTPPRTAADLARLAGADPASSAALLGLVSAFPGVLDSARAWFDAHGPVPGKRDGLAVIDRMRAEVRTT
ncbi:MAG TPA: type IV toxin-antitoxin system AbiEi family antitoxin [Microbacterium sp.]|uniref:type IV toxin-antitoxin system AbiEi family antitoxin n=1 Tax=Microbacterium sp. TaxID=51671 RepID=UPI002CA12E61|nr:type IV toxin-antitoxin system AbiEi family antitoxin [Microbacterium sp.]HWI32058.1 type IV toxin-antitoxin system AbiEi family antitoxin [Microbacterium sp.]